MGFNGMLTFGRSDSFDYNRRGPAQAGVVRNLCVPSRIVVELGCWVSLAEPLRYSVAGARLAVRFRGGGGRRLIAGGRGFRKVAEHLAGNFAPDAVKAADLREHSIATDPFGGAADKAHTVSLIGFRRGIRMAFDAGFAIAVQIGDGAGDGAFEADLSEVDAVDGQGEFAGGGTAGSWILASERSMRANFH